MNENSILNKKSGNSVRARTRQVVETKQKNVLRPAHERIPPDVWNRLQQCGSDASLRLQELLISERFEKLRTGDQVQLMRLAFEYAYGKPDAPLKSEVKVKLSTANSDAVSLAMQRLADMATLPEHLDLTAKDVTK